MPGAERQAQVRQRDEDEAMQKHDTIVGRVGPEQSKANRASDQEPGRSADERSENARHRRFTQTTLEQDYEGGNREAEGDVGGNGGRQRTQHRGRVGDDSDEDEAPEREPGHGSDPRYERPPDEHAMNEARRPRPAGKISPIVTECA